jgi:adenylosuccinate lyase
MDSKTTALTTYTTPLTTRYASPEMCFNFSQQKRIRTWRQLWAYLAKAEMQSGLKDITQEMVDELEAHIV